MAQEGKVDGDRVLWGPEPRAEYTGWWTDYSTRIEPVSLSPDLRVRITQEVFNTCVLENEWGYSRGAGSELRGVGGENGRLGGWGQGQPLHPLSPL